MKANLDKCLLLLDFSNNQENKIGKGIITSSQYKKTLRVAVDDTDLVLIRMQISMQKRQISSYTL